ncbi:cation transporting ATPase C-terminal domain-containing protein [Roseiflexus castenholzii]|uniref:cation transporting ATPase C-terminal domain-containing protein n=1 Tax=Roseiflexus castenholzii TaxID=120962 RepID=UPI003C797600
MLNCRSLTHSMLQIGGFSNRWLFVGIGTMILLQPGFTRPPWMGQILNSAPISLEAWGASCSLRLWDMRRSRPNHGDAAGMPASAARS